MKTKSYLTAVAITLFLGWIVGQAAVAKAEQYQARQSATVEQSLRHAFE
jgi:hypothetical protein